MVRGSRCFTLEDRGVLRRERVPSAEEPNSRKTRRGVIRREEGREKERTIGDKETQKKR